MRRTASRQHTCSCFPLICAVAAIADAITNLFQIDENFHHDSLSEETHPARGDDQGLVASILTEKLSIGTSRGAWFV